MIIVDADDLVLKCQVISSHKCLPHAIFQAFPFIDELTLRVSIYAAKLYNLAFMK